MYNHISVLATNYLHRANRTIETLLINEQQTLYLYNHQGLYYKLFDQKEELDNYFNALPYKMLCEFYSEEEVGVYLEKRREHSLNMKVTVSESSTDKFPQAFLNEQY